MVVINSCPSFIGRIACGLLAVAAERAWQHLRAHRFDGFYFRRQQIIDSFIVDFYCHSVGLAIEVDGEVRQNQVAYGAKRDGILKARGFQVLRIANVEIRTNSDGVLQSIRAYIK
jgi:very-short-patch-repair endonuclease